MTVSAIDISRWLISWLFSWYFYTVIDGWFSSSDSFDAPKNVECQIPKKSFKKSDVLFIQIPIQNGIPISATFCVKMRNRLFFCSSKVPVNCLLFLVVHLCFRTLLSIFTIKNSSIPHLPKSISPGFGPSLHKLSLLLLESTFFFSCPSEKASFDFPTVKPCETKECSKIIYQAHENTISFT